MTLEKVELTGEETAVAGGRTPLEMEAGQKYKLTLRGLGAYEGGAEKDFETGEMTGRKIENAALIVCNPADAEEVYVVSATVKSVMGKSILNMAEKVDGVFFLKHDLLNAIGYLGMEEVKTDESYNKGFKKLYWNADMKKGKVVYMKGDMPAETVGASQRDTMEVEGEEGEVEM